MKANSARQLRDGRQVHCARLTTENGNFKLHSYSIPVYNMLECVLILTTTQSNLSNPTLARKTKRQNLVACSEQFAVVVDEQTELFWHERGGRCCATTDDGASCTQRSSSNERARAGSAPRATRVASRCALLQPRPLICELLLSVGRLTLVCLCCFCSRQWRLAASSCL